MSVNKQQIQEIVAELCARDPSLKGKERELLIIVEKIAHERPQININPAFIKKLRSELLLPAQQTTEKNVVNYFFMNKYIYAFYGAGVTVLILALSVAIVNRESKPVVVQEDNTPITQVALAPQINQLADGAFGSLKGLSNNTAVSSEMTAFGRGAGGGVAMTSSVAPAPTVDAKMIMPYPMTNYIYNYKGEALTLSGEKQAVLRRTKGMSGSADASALVAGLGIDFVNLNALGNQNLQNLTLVQRQDYGYITNISVDEGLVTIYQNWETWPSGKCGSDNNCFEAQRTQLSDLGDEAGMLEVASRFISDYGIDLTNYGEPEINNDWRRYYESMTDKSNYYFPESVEIIYPQIVNGKFVYDEWSGAKTGISVSVNPKLKRVTGVNNLVTKNYESSMYEMESDVQKIMDALKHNNNVMPYMTEVEQKTVNIDLGDPEEVYVKIYIYRDNKNSELLVPALRFPILNRPDDMNFYRKSVIVPLSVEIMSDRYQIMTPVVDGPMPTPMVK